MIPAFPETEATKIRHGSRPAPKKTWNWPRAPFRWPGGKGNLKKHILPLLPPHKHYCEPFCGAASIFFSKPPSPIETLNDIDGRIINLFRVLQNEETHHQLQYKLWYTPYSRAEFCKALDILKDNSADDIDRAWAFFVAQNQGFGGKANSEGDWGHAIIESCYGRAGAVNRWLMRLYMLDWFRIRLMNVQLENKSWEYIINVYDSGATLFYVDPPYAAYASKGKLYANELSLDEHQKLIKALLAIKGRAIVSAYWHEVYAPLMEAGWQTQRIETVSHLAGRGKGSGLQGKGAVSAKAKCVETIICSPGIVAQQQSVFS